MEVDHTIEFVEGTVIDGETWPFVTNINYTSRTAVTLVNRNYQFENRALEVLQHLHDCQQDMDVLLAHY